MSFLQRGLGDILQQQQQQPRRDLDQHQQQQRPDQVDNPPSRSTPPSSSSPMSPLEDPEYDVATQEKLAILLEEEDLEYFEGLQAQPEMSTASTSTITPTTSTPLVRSHSTASTEIVDPDSQDIMAGLVTKGIKVRDFAFKQPSSSSVTPPPPVTEIFDQYRALTELDYRWTQPNRTYPIQGRTLRRLLDMGWLTHEELNARGAQIDFDELDKYDAQTEPQYPWRPFRWTTIPTAAERMDLLSTRRVLWWHVDRMRGQQENADAWEVEMRRQVALHIARVEQMEREMKSNGGRITTGCGSKRRLDDGEGGEGGGEPRGDETDEEGLASVDENGVKRRRITPEPGLPVQGPSRSQYPAYNNQYPALIPPAKQYPAPLHTYNPELYPEAATVIESASQSSSQPRPVIPPPRADTPPLDEEEPSASQETSPGRRLVHPRTLRMNGGGLSRTQTFTQLAV